MSVVSAGLVLRRLLIPATFLMGAALVWQTWRVWEQHQRLVRHEQQARQRQFELQQLRSALDRQSVALAEIQRELDASSAIVRETLAADATLTAWLERVDRLKALLEHAPERRIPEMRYLNSNDWLSVTLDNPLSTDAEIRVALRKLRQMAKAKPEVGPNLKQALEAYARAHAGQSPATVEALVPHLKSPLPDEILVRYRVPATNPATTKPWLRGFGNAALEEVEPVDENYDSRLYFSDQGWTFYGTSKIGDAVGAAHDAYRKANSGRSPETPDQILPYLGGTVDPAKLREWWQVKDRN